MRGVQAYFFGWGFYVLGQDDALERKLTGRPTNPVAPPATGACVGDHTSSRRDSPDVSPPREVVYRSNDNGCPEQESIEIAGEGKVAIEIEPCDEEIPSEAAAAVNNDVGDDRDDGVGDRRVGVKQRIRRIVVSPNIISVTIGVIISMIAPLQERMFDNPRAVLRPLGAALQVRFPASVAVEYSCSSRGTSWCTVQ